MQLTAEKLIEAVSRPVRLPDGETVDVSVSLGAAFVPHTVSTDSESLLAHADRALYQAKQAGRHRCACVDIGAAEQSLDGAD
jgi:diguanylate cyclase (GGDEF)-like protein